MGTPIVATLADLPDEVDMIDVFRRSEAVPDIVEEALSLLPNFRTIWLQLGVERNGEGPRGRGWNWLVRTEPQTTARLMA